MPTPNTWRTLWKLIGRAVQRPGALLKSLSWVHVKTLLYALRHEPPSLILYNFTQLLIGGKRYVTRHENLLIDEDQLKLFLDHLFLSDRKIELSGWCLSAKKKLDRLVLFQGDHKCGTLAYGLHRPDLFAKHGKDYDQVGFHAVLPLESVRNALRLELVFADGQRREATLPDVRQEDRYEAMVIMEADLRPTIPQLKRFLRKHNRDLPCLYLQVSTDQWTVLQTHVYPFPVFRFEHQKPDSKDWVLQLAPDVQPAMDLIWQIGKALLECSPNCSLIYWDEDVILPSGKRTSPHLKPDFDPDYLLSYNYIGPNLAFRFGSLNGTNSGIQHPLRVLSSRPTRTSGSRIPMVLSHQPSDTSYKDFNEKEERTAFLARHAPEASIKAGLLPDTYRILYPVNKKAGVTIMIPFRDGVYYLKKCLESIAANTRYPELKILLIDNQSKEAATLDYVEEILHSNDQIHRIFYDQPFNYAAMHNEAIQQVDTPYALLLNNDIEAIEPGWLEAMMEYAQQDRVGAVGAKLLYPDRTIQHAGVVIGIGGAADHAQKHLEEWAPGYLNQAQVAKQWTACTAACLLLRVNRWREVGGMDAGAFPIAFNDVDLCLKLYQAGYDIVYTPFAKLLHHESVSRGKDLSPKQRDRASREIRTFQKKWRTFLDEGDPYYHPCFSIRSAHFELA